MQFLSRLFAPSWRRRAVDLGCVVALAAWVFWWFDALKTFHLRGVERFWFKIPGLGVDFWTESELFARTWAARGDPYLNEVRLFHYPPLVLRLFSWVAYFEPFTALRLWVPVLGIIIVASTVVAARQRRRVGIPELSALHALPLVLFNTAVVFEMERANWDFISFVPIMLAVPLLKPGRAPLDFLAGCLLAVCPWVKIYPGLLVIALLALRRWYAVAGFGAACVGLLASMFRETLRSLHIIKLAMDMVRQLGWFGGAYPPWVHSLSAAWLRFLYLTVGRTKGERIIGYTAWAWALVVVLPLLAWVGVRVFRSRSADRLVYAWLLWTVAVASFVPDIANDYSLAFLPVAAIAVSSLRDPLLVKVGLVLLALWWQPFALPIPGSAMLAIKLVGVIAVGGSIVTRLRELDTQATTPENVPPSAM